MSAEAAPRRELGPPVTLLMLGATVSLVKVADAKFPQVV